MVKRVILPVGVVFKGSGWYITDSRKSNGAESSSTETSAKDGDSDAKKTKKDGESDAKKVKKDAAAAPANA